MIILVRPKWGWLSVILMYLSTQLTSARTALALIQHVDDAGKVLAALFLAFSILGVKRSGLLAHWNLGPGTFRRFHGKAQIFEHQRSGKAALIAIIRRALRADTGNRAIAGHRPVLPRSLG